MSNKLTTLTNDKQNFLNLMNDKSIPLMKKYLLGLNILDQLDHLECQTLKQKTLFNCQDLYIYFQNPNSTTYTPITKDSFECLDLINKQHFQIVDLSSFIDKISLIFNSQIKFWQNPLKGVM